MANPAAPPIVYVVMNPPRGYQAVAALARHPRVLADLGGTPESTRRRASPPAPPGCAETGGPHRNGGVVRLQGVILTASENGQANPDNGVRASPGSVPSLSGRRSRRANREACRDRRRDRG